MKRRLLMVRDFMRRTLLLVLLLQIMGCFSIGPKEREPTRQKPLAPEVAVEVAPERRIDNRPYEFIWSDRVEAHAPLVDFEGLLGWTVQTSTGTLARLDRTDELQLWGRYVGRLTITAPADAPGTVTIKPPQPLPVRHFFDCLQIWVHGHGKPRGDTRGAQLAVLLGDAEGRTLSLPLANIDWSNWWLVHRKLDPSLTEELVGDVSFVGLEFSNCVAPTGAVLYMDSLAFYGERLAPLETPVLPKRNVKLGPGQKAGLNTGTNVLTFPVRATTLLPASYFEHHDAKVKQLSEYVFNLTHMRADGELVFTFDASRGLQSLSASWRGASIGRLLRGAQFAGDFPEKDEVIALQQEDHGLRVEYASGLRLHLSLNRHALVIDVVCRGGKLREFSLGSLGEAGRLQSLSLPYLSWGDEAPPRIGLLGAGDEKVFVSLLLDWYRSNGSVLFGPSSANTAEINGGVRYRPTTSGRRNDCYERLIVSVSPEMEDVLPVAANPRGSRSRELVDRLWVPASPLKYEEEQLRLAQHAALGLEHVIYCSDKSTWQSAEESFSLRTRAAPRRGGDATLSWFLDEVAAYGWKRGLHANYCDISPLNRYWNANELQRMESGEWRRASTKSYALKASRSISWLGELAPIIAEKFSTDAVYMDAHSSMPPWDNTDYDARIPGAATLAQTYYCYGQLLQDASSLYRGPVIGAGGNQWMYGGLADAHRADPRRSGIEAFAPLLPLFYVSRLNPLGVGFGMGSVEEFFRAVPSWIDKRDHRIDQYMATEIAYGHAGRVVSDRYGWTLVARSYYMLQQLQQRYVLLAPKRLAYRDGADLVDTSAAIKSGAYEKGQLYVHYPSDLELWVNGSDAQPWEVRVGRDTWTLPPYGWVAQAPGFFELSGLVDGHRIDYVESEAYIYYDGRGSMTPFRGLVSATPIVVRHEGEDRGKKLEVIDVARTGSFALGVDAVGLGGRVSCEAFDDQAKSLGVVEIEQRNDMLWIAGKKEALRYVLQVGVADP